MAVRMLSLDTDLCRSGRDPVPALVVLAVEAEGKWGIIPLCPALSAEGGVLFKHSVPENKEQPAGGPDGIMGLRLTVELGVEPAVAAYNRLLLLLDLRLPGPLMAGLGLTFADSSIIICLNKVQKL